MPSSSPRATPNPNPKENHKPHYAGHRDRLRARFLDTPEGLPDYELLELILFMAIPRRDVKPIAKTLIARFKSFAGVLNASVADLTGVTGISETTAIALKSVQSGARRLIQQELMTQPLLNNWERLLDYLHAMMADEKIEQFRLLFLNKKNELIADEVQQRGTIDHTPAYPREIVKRALELGASAIILVHNHPSGDPNPSQADVDMTNDVVAAANALGINVHDHLIVTKSETISFKTMGLI